MGACYSLRPFVANEGSDSESVLRIALMGRDYTVEKWKGEPCGSNRGIIHPKDLDFSVDMIPIANALPRNIKTLLKKTKIHDSENGWRSSTRRQYTMRSVSYIVEGITLQALEDILKKNKRSEAYQTKELVDNIFNPRTVDEKCTMLRKLKGTKDSSGCQAVGVMDYFVSYSWSYTIGALIGALREFEKTVERESDKPIYFFIDCVCINQWYPDKHIDNLDQTISSSKGLVMVIIDWENPIPFQRAWCLFEISIALTFNIPIHVAMTDVTMRILRRALFSDFDDVVQKIHKIDVRNAKATFEKDLIEIKNKIKHMIGYSQLNNRVINALKDWLVDEGDRMIKAMSNTGDTSTDQRVLLDKLEIFAKLKRHMGDYMAAWPMYEKIYNERLKLLGAENIATIVAQCNYGNHLRELLKLDAATVLLTNCAKMATKTLGDNHTITLIAQACLGLLQKNLGNLKEAEKVLREVIRKGVHATGPWARDWDNLTRASNLALILQLQGKTKQACALLERCHVESEKMLGQRHEFTMIDMHNLGAARWRLGNHEDAERILERCYEGRIEVLREGHVRTLMTLWWWAISSMRLGKLERAREQLSEVMFHLKQLYGSSEHKRVRACRRLYEAITPDELKDNLLVNQSSDERLSGQISFRG